LDTNEYLNVLCCGYVFKDTHILYVVLLNTRNSL